MHFWAFQALLRTKMHVLCLSPPYFDFKNETIFTLNGFIIKKYGGESLRHALLYVLGHETHNNACLVSFPTRFRFTEETIYKLICFFFSKKVGEDKEHALLCFLGPEMHKNACLRSYPTTFW